MYCYKYAWKKEEKGQNHVALTLLVQFLKSMPVLKIPIYLPDTIKEYHLAMHFTSQFPMFHLFRFSPFSLICLKL